MNPAWARFDGTYLWLTTTGRAKCRNWRVQPAVPLSILDPDRPHRHREIRGRVERVVPDLEAAEFLRLAEHHRVEQPGPPPDTADRIGRDPAAPQDYPNDGSGIPGHRGIRSTAGVVTSAAVIMVVVFSIFGSLGQVSMKEIGIGLAVAVLLDATIVRAVLPRPR